MEQLCKKEREKKQSREYMYTLLTRKKCYERVNKEALYHVLGMYDVDGKLLNGIKSTYANSLDCGGGVMWVVRVSHL